MQRPYLESESKLAVRPEKGPKRQRKDREKTEKTPRLTDWSQGVFCFGSNGTDLIIVIIGSSIGIIAAISIRTVIPIGAVVFIGTIITVIFGVSRVLGA